MFIGMYKLLAAQVTARGKQAIWLMQCLAGVGEVKRAAFEPWDMRHATCLYSGEGPQR